MDDRPKIESLESFSAYFNVSRETARRLETYHSLLLQWQKAVQLVAPKTLECAWSRHFADSAQLLALVGESAAKTWVDLGSGGGFPGLVVAIIRAELGTRVVLVESDRRKSSFLREVARQCGIAVDIVTERVETWANTATVPPVDVVSARALAPLPLLFAYAAPLFGPETLGLFPKGRDVDAELSAARAQWAFDVAAVESLTDRDGRVLCVRNLQRKC